MGFPSGGPLTGTFSTIIIILVTLNNNCCSLVFTSDHNHMYAHNAPKYEKSTILGSRDACSRSLPQRLNSIFLKGPPEGSGVEPKYGKH